MARAIINIKTDKQVKEHAQKLAKELGLSLSDVVNSSLRNFIKSRSVYYSAIPHMTSELEYLLGKVEKDVKANHNISAGFSSFEEIENHLNGL